MLGGCDPHRARLCSYRRSRKGDAARGMASPEKRGGFFSSNCCSGEIAQPFVECLLPFLKDYLKNSTAGSLCRSVNFVAGGASGQDRFTESLPSAARVPVCARLRPCAGSVRPSGRPSERSRRTGLRTGLLKSGSE